MFTSAPSFGGSCAAEGTATAAAAAASVHSIEIEEPEGPFFFIKDFILV